MNNLLSDFYALQQSREASGDTSGSALVGYVLEANYDSFTVSTNTALQRTAGSLARGSFLLAMADPERAVLLRVQEVASSPLRSLETMTMYELSKRAMPALDQLTNTDMSWACYRCDVLGSYYEYGSQVLFAGDLDLLLAPAEYRVYTAGQLLPLVVNGACGQDQKGIFQDRLREKSGLATYVSAFLAVPVESLAACRALPPGGDRTRAIRRVQMLWAVLYTAGFPVNETALSASAPSLSAKQSPFDPGFSAALREALYGQPVPPAPASLQALCGELEALNRYRKQQSGSSLLQTASGNPLLEPDDLAVLNFLFPNGASSGVKALSCCRSLHNANAGDFLTEIPALLDQSKTVILDLSNASPTLIEFLTGQVCAKIFHHQEDLFTQNALGSHFVQLYAEEAHNYFPAKDTDTGIFARIAKEGAKYHMGLVYATQSPSTISGELLSQTENFFVAHLDSAHEVDALVRRSAPFTGVGTNILKTRTPGYVHLLTASQRYPVPVQIANFRDVGVV